MTAIPDTPATDGFTLLELITVLGVIAILSGLGIGFLSRSDNDLDIALAVLRDKTRLAYETARNTGRPATVELLFRRGEDQDVVGQFLRAKVLSVIGQWHLEPDERPFAGLVPTLGGVHEAEGRYGYCMRPNPEKGGTLFSVSTVDQPRFRVIDGFALKIELYLVERKKCVVATLAPTFTLELDEELRPVASLVLAEPGPRRGPTVDIITKDSELPLRRWVTLEIVHDGRVFRLLVDGIAIGEKSASGEPFQERGALFEVSPDNSPVPGRVDEIQLMGYERDEPAELPPDVVIQGLEQPVAYDRHGNLTRPVTFEITLGEQKRTKKVAPGGVLQ